jgi:hypothetical protein
MSMGLLKSNIKIDSKLKKGKAIVHDDEDL